MTVPFRSYRFDRQPHWERCLLHGFDIKGSAISLAGRFASAARPVGGTDRVTAVALGRDHNPMWRVIEDSRAYFVEQSVLDCPGVRVEIAEPLATSPRWIADRRSLWSFARNESRISRYDVETLESQASRDVGAHILDIASDQHEGVWLLTRSGETEYGLVNVECSGQATHPFPVPHEACRPAQIVSIGHRRLAILAAEGRRLVILDTSTRSVERVLEMENVAAGLTVIRMASDRRRIALLGTIAEKSTSVLVLLDRNGDPIDGPIEPRFDRKNTAVPLEILDIAVSPEAMWLATTSGLWTMAADSADASDAEGTLLTPALISPESFADRGWLRAELEIELSRGAVVKASFASTNNEAVATQLTAIAGDTSASTHHRQQQIWNLLEHPSEWMFTFSGPATPAVPLTIPLFAARDRWLWLYLQVTSPPGSAPGVIRKLRVLYPNASIDRYLPATFKEKEHDPSGVLRRLVGVLESTTQGIDERIDGIGGKLLADTAPIEWLDYIARWLDLPWDDSLGESAKRALIRYASEIIEHRGTRRGLERLLASLLDGSGAARVTDATVDHPVTPLGGGGRRGAELPLILAGASPRIATLNVKAVLGRARIRCNTSDVDPLRAIVPTVTIRIAAERGAAAALTPILPRLMSMYLPAGVVVRLRWQTTPFADALDDDGIRLDAAGPGRLGDTSRIGQTVLGGRAARGLTDTGVDTDLRLA